jgi:hypothetical protein
MKSEQKDFFTHQIRSVLPLLLKIEDFMSPN